MPLDWSPLVDTIRRHHTILLMTHIRPDADGLGSQLALADALVRMGKRPRVAIASKLAPRYAFLDPQRKVIEDFRAPGDDFRDADAIFVMDTGTWNQLGDFADFLPGMDVPKAVIDHHRTQDDLGAERFVDVTAEATGRLTYEIIRALGAPLSQFAAHSLFMALAMDTGWFRHSNTTADTFALAGELVRAGANPTPLYEQLFETAPVARLKLLGIALDRLQVVCNGLVAYTEIHVKDYVGCGAVPGDTEDIINYPRSVDGAEVALVFMEQPDGGTKVSFRARSRVDVSKVAEQFGGGGHKLASGARTGGDLPATRAAVLKAVEAALNLPQPR
jgi:phosphoesterase RecJ-like protein